MRGNKGFVDFIHKYRKGIFLVLLVVLVYVVVIPFLKFTADFYPPVYGGLIVMTIVSFFLFVGFDYLSLFVNSENPTELRRKLSKLKQQFEGAKTEIALWRETTGCKSAKHYKTPAPRILRVGPDNVFFSANGDDLSPMEASIVGGKTWKQWAMKLGAALSSSFERSKLEEEKTKRLVADLQIAKEDIDELSDQIKKLKQSNQQLVASEAQLLELCGSYLLGLLAFRAWDDVYMLELEALETERSGHSEFIRQHLASLQAAQDEIQSLQQKLDSALSDNKKYGEDVAKFFVEKNELLEKLRCLKQSTVKVVQPSNNYQDLEIELKQLRSQVDSKSNELGNYVRNYKQLVSEKRELESSLASLQNQLTSVLPQVDKLKDEANKAKSHNAKLLAEKQELQTNVKSLTAESETVKAELERVSTLLAKVQDELNQSIEVSFEVHQQLASLRNESGGQHAELQSEKSKLELQVQELLTKLEVADAQVNKLTFEIASAKRELVEVSEIAVEESIRFNGFRIEAEKSISELTKLKQTLHAQEELILRCSLFLAEDGPFYRFVELQRDEFENLAAVREIVNLVLPELSRNPKGKLFNDNQGYKILRMFATPENAAKKLKEFHDAISEVLHAVPNIGEASRC